MHTSSFTIKDLNEYKVSGSPWFIMYQSFFAINLSAVKYHTANHFMEPFGMKPISWASALLYFGQNIWLSCRRKNLPKAKARFFCCAPTIIAINQMLFLSNKLEYL